MEHAISFIAREKAALIEIDAPTPPAPNEILGRTLFTLVSPGTELNWQYRGKDFPTFPGYAARRQVRSSSARAATAAIKR